MKTVLVEYVLQEPASRAQKIEETVNVANNIFKGLPGLISKQWTYDETTGKGLNVYLWESAEAADNFFDDEFAARFESRFGAHPTVTKLDTLALVDNKSGEIIVNQG